MIAFSYFVQDITLVLLWLKRLIHLYWIAIASKVSAVVLTRDCEAGLADLWIERNLAMQLTTCEHEFAARFKLVKDSILMSHNVASKSHLHERSWVQSSSGNLKLGTLTVLVHTLVYIAYICLYYTCSFQSCSCFMHRGGL